MGDEELSVAEQLAKKVIADASRKKAKAPLYSIPDENGGLIFDHQRLKEDLLKRVPIAVLVIVLASAICWFGVQVTDLIKKDHDELVRKSDRNYECIGIIAEGQRSVMMDVNQLGKALQQHDPKVLIPPELRQGVLPK